jgi:hypothetical protein
MRIMETQVEVELEKVKMFFIEKEIIK